MDKRGLVYTNTVSTPSISSDATALDGSTTNKRSSWFIQNLGTNTLFVRRGGTATTEVFDYALKAGSLIDEGTGGSVGESGPVVFTGDITVAGTSPRYVATETT